MDRSSLKMKTARLSKKNTKAEIEQGNVFVPNGFDRRMCLLHNLLLNTEVLLFEPSRPEISGLLHICGFS